MSTPIHKQSYKARKEFFTNKSMLEEERKDPAKYMLLCSNIDPTGSTLFYSNDNPKVIEKKRMDKIRKEERIAREAKEAKLLKDMKKKAKAEATLKEVTEEVTEKVTQEATKEATENLKITYEVPDTWEDL